MSHCARPVRAPKPCRVLHASSARAGNKLASVPDTDPESTFVLFSAKMTLGQKIFFLIIGGIASLISQILDFVSNFGPDLTPVVFPQPFVDFGKNKVCHHPPGLACVLCLCL